jgi:hypothetical protein
MLNDETLPPGVRTEFRKVVEAPQWQRPSTSRSTHRVGDRPTPSHSPRGAPAPQRRAAQNTGGRVRTSSRALSIGRSAMWPRSLE